jgi:hypothetical protein
MKDYVLKTKPEPAANETVWAFDLGKGSIGEAVRRGNEFLHKASLPCRAVAQRRLPCRAIAQRRLVIPAEFAETKTAAGRRRMWRTRQAHKAAISSFVFSACQPDYVNAATESLLKMHESVSINAIEKKYKANQQ